MPEIDWTYPKILSPKIDWTFPDPANATFINPALANLYQKRGWATRVKADPNRSIVPESYTIIQILEEGQDLWCEDWEVRMDSDCKYCGFETLEGLCQNTVFS